MAEPKESVDVYYAHNSFAAWLERRLAAKVGRLKTDRQITQEAGVPAATLSRIFRQRIKPSRDVADKLARYLDIPIPEFRLRAGLAPIHVEAGAFSAAWMRDEDVERVLAVLEEARRRWREEHKKGDTDHSVSPQTEGC